MIECHGDEILSHLMKPLLITLLSQQFHLCLIEFNAIKLVVLDGCYGDETSLLSDETLPINYLVNSEILLMCH